MINRISYRKKIIILVVAIFSVCVFYVVSINKGLNFLNKKEITPDINVATPSGAVTFNLVKLTADPIYPNTKVKYAVRVSSGGAVNVTALGFKIKSTLPVSNYVMGTPIVSGIEIKEFFYDSSANTLSFIAATATSFQIGNGADLVTFDVTAPASAGTYNSVLSSITGSALPSLLDTNNNEILNSSSLSAVTLNVSSVVTIPTVPTNFKQTCAADGKSATFTWSAPAGATAYYFRLDYTEGGGALGGPNDFVKDNFVETSVTATIVPDKNYHAWLHAANSAGIGSPADITSFYCAAPNAVPVGNLDSVTCAEIAGWACDATNYATPIEAHIYADGQYGTGTMVASGVANINRGDVSSYCGGNAAHGFSIPFPASKMDGKAHSFYAYAIDIPAGNQNPILPNSPKTITCFPAPAVPTNFKATCSTDGTQVTLSWDPQVGTAAKYYLRNDNTSNVWPNGAGDYYDDNVNASSKVIPISVGAPYHAWVHGVSSTGAVGPQADINYTCSANSGPVIGNLVVKGTTLTADDQVAISYLENVAVTVNGVTDPDGIKTVVFQRVEDNNANIGGLSGSASSTYTLNINNIQIGKYTIKVVATDNKDRVSTKVFYFFYARPAAVTISPNGGTYATLPYVAITNPNPFGTSVVYGFCTTDCATKTVSTAYNGSFAAQAGSRVVSYVNHAASGLTSARVITEMFNQQSTPTPTPSPSKVPTPTPSVTPTKVPTPTPSPTKVPTPTPTPTVVVPTPSPTPSGNAGTFNVNPLADSYVFGSDTGTNFGSENSLQLKNGSGSTYDRIAFLKFNLSSISGSISSAKLRLFINSAPNGTPTSTTAYGLSNDSWTENGLNFGNMPTIGSSISSALSVNTLNSWYEMDITSYIQSEYAGDKTASVVLQADNNSQTGIDSKEGTNKPVLVVNTSGTSTVSTPTFSLTPGSYIYNRGNSLENKSITISSATSGATILTCMASSITATSCTTFSTYSAPILVNKNFKLFAKATKSGLSDSSVATGVYQLLGDINGDNAFTLAGDIIPTLNAIFESSLKTALMDMDANGLVDLRDLLKIIELMLS